MVSSVTGAGGCSDRTVRNTSAVRHPAKRCQHLLKGLGVGRSGQDEHSVQVEHDTSDRRGPGNATPFIVSILQRSQSNMRFLMELRRTNLP